MKEDT